MFSNVRIRYAIGGAILAGAVALSSTVPASAAPADFRAWASELRSSRVASQPAALTATNSAAVTPAAVTQATPLITPGSIRSALANLRQAVRSRDVSAVRQSVRQIVQFVREGVSPN